jgi:short-subunit dehydrogenase
MGKFEPNTYAIITGASSGIGREIAQELAKKQLNLILVARRRDRLEALKKKLETEYSIKVIVKDVDLSVMENCVRLHAETIDYHPIIVINNAGFGQIGPFDEGSLVKEQAMIAVNISAVQLLTRLFVDTLSEGIILNVSSMAGFLPTPLMATYAASKAFVVNFSRAIDFEMRREKRRIRVLSLCPGPVKTEFGLVAHGRETGRGIDASRAAKIAVRGIEKEKALIIPGIQMKVVHFFLRLLPTRWILTFAYRLQKNK